VASLADYQKDPDIAVPATPERVLSAITALTENNDASA